MFFLFFGIQPVFSQIKTLIPSDQEVDLPLDSTSQIFLSTMFTETRLNRQELKRIIFSEAKSNLDTRYYHIIDTGDKYIDFFVLYPCKSFNINNIQKHEIISEGLITSTLRLLFYDEEYEFILRDFEWVRDKKTKIELSPIYKKYHLESDIKFKVRHYGILKSAEFSILESVNHFTAIINEIIKSKSEIKE